MGDQKSGRLNADMVIGWAIRKRVILDHDIIRNMFAEADYKHEGSISTAQFRAALTCMQV